MSQLAPSEYLRAVQADLGRPAALQAYQFLTAALTAARVRTLGAIQGTGRILALSLVTEQDRQVARFTAHALAEYPELIIAMWQHLALLSCDIEHDAVRELLHDAAQIFADSLTIAEAA